MPVATDQFAAAWETFFRTTRRLRSRAGKQSLEGLSLPQYHLLEALRDDGRADRRRARRGRGRRAADRHAHARLPGCATATSTRRHSEDDRRAVLVSLTPSGRAAVQAAHEQVSAWRRRVFESLEPDEREQAAALLTRLSQAMEEQMP